jgi:hypothetical protein
LAENYGAWIAKVVRLMSNVRSYVVHFSSCIGM